MSATVIFLAQLRRMSSSSVTSTPNAEALEAEAEAQADRANTSMDNLFWHLCEFLVYVLRETWRLPMSGHATEQAQTQISKSSKEAIIEKEREDTSFAEDCENIVYQKIEEWADRRVDQSYYNEPALLLHKRMWNLVQHKKKA